MKALITLLVVCLLQCLTTGCAHKGFHEPPASSFKMTPVPLTPENWTVIYDGGGKVEFNAENSGDLVFQPQISKSKDQTFATLILLKNSISHPIQNYAVKVEVTTAQQLRTTTIPNDWEVFWFFGNYQQTNPKQKTANYFTQKPNSGIELGKAFESTGQQFLKTDPAEKLEIGKRNTYLFVKKAQHFAVYQNEKVIFTYDGNKNDQPNLYNQPGALGLYTEDAKIKIHSFAYQVL